MQLIQNCYLSTYLQGDKKKFVLKNTGTNIIGRKAKIVNPVVNVSLDTDDQEISRKHCQLKILLSTAGHIFLLKDLGSRNGIVVFNRQRQAMAISGTDEIFIENGYILQLGQTEFEFHVKYAEQPTRLKL